MAIVVICGSVVVTKMKKINLGPATKSTISLAVIYLKTLSPSWIKALSSSPPPLHLAHRHSTILSTQKSTPLSPPSSAKSHPITWQSPRKPKDRWYIATNPTNTESSKLWQEEQNINLHIIYYVHHTISYRKQFLQTTNLHTLIQPRLSNITSDLTSHIHQLAW